MNKHTFYVNGEYVRIYFTKHIGSAVSLGKYIHVDPHSYFNLDTFRHEMGHQRQSLYLGPLYLILVGIPSITRNIYHRLFHKNWKAEDKISWYYGSYPENWADKLGKVKR